MSTMHFEPVSPQVRLPQVENEVLAFWRESDVFHKSLQKTQDCKPYVFYDGPPFATGLPHYGHLLAGTIKDIIPRYWTMRQHYVGRRFGWDCHGLPVENEMERELNISGKRDIERLGVHLFNEACRSIVLRYTSQWEEIVQRMGRWVDFVEQYRTMDPPFMESIWWVFKQVWDKQLIYQGFRVQPYCPRCTTPLSNFEVNEGYKDTTGPSITVTFPLADDPKTKVLVWTTTPWTLPSNVALAVGADIEYLKIRDGDDVFILAKDRLSAYYRDTESYQVLEKLKGKDLVGLRYEPLFEFFRDNDARFFQITEADFVSTEDGTGVVHIAPAFGEDDFAVGAKLELPIVCPVDEEGRFTDEVPEWHGRVVYEADDDITATIKRMGRLVHKTKVEHRYPFCYRCDTALIYKAITTWFMKIEPLRKNMLENNQRIHWVPDHLKNGRFGKGIESAPDWNISRNRYWGTPLPIWLCECGHKECVGSLEQLHTLLGNGDTAEGEATHTETARTVAKRVKEDVGPRLEEFKVEPGWAEKIKSTDINDRDIHRHIVDELCIPCPSCGKQMERTPEVLDCWFESGSMPYAQSHYPFDNKESFEQAFPADFIAEGLDQTRGWFYTLTVLASALFDSEAFRNVVVNGIILAEDGKKLSKRLRNYVPPTEVLNTLGADALRLFLINSPAVKAEDLRFSEHGVREMSRAILLPFWNAYSFFVTYANVDGWKPDGGEWKPSENELDRWIVSLLNHVVGSVNAEMEEYNLYRVVPNLVDFIENLTNWYIRRSRRRFWKSENDTDKEDAYRTLYYVLVEFSKVMAPSLPFLTEAIYRNLVVRNDDSAPESIHLTEYPISDESLIDRDLETKMRIVRQVVTMGRVLRSRHNIKNRQPLQSLDVVIKDDAKRALVAQMADLIREELNVKEVVFDANEDTLVSISAKPNYRTLGKKFGPRMKDAAVLIEGFGYDDIRALEAGEARQVLGHEIGFDDIVVQRTKHEGIEVETQEDVTVGLNTEITRELLEECHAREFVNRIQNLRKSKDFNVTDRIAVTCDCSEAMRSALEGYEEYIRNETLASKITWGVPKSMDSPEKVDVNGTDLLVSVQVVKE